ncbi:MAG: class I SAM-dependent methyltransferase, partial [bacterium]
MDSTPSVTDLATSETAASRETTATTPGRKECIACESHAVQQFLDLGETALANKFITEGELAEPEEKYPLRVGFCHTCGHVQLTERVPPDAMFTDYLYMSSASDTLMAHFQELSETMVERHELNANDLVIDIGCNDASLLECFRQLGVKTLGVDPAENLAELFSDNGIDRYTGYFNSRTVREILPRWGKATLVTATNTFPHIPQLHDFVEAIDTILAPGGVFVIETHYLVDLLDQVAFDTVYHEHVSYWALGPMMHLFEQHGLEIVYAERLPLHHGQLRASVKRRGSGKVNPSVGELLAVEQDRGIDRFETYESFARRAHSMKQQLRRTLTGLKTKG